jgi:peptide/nickel transport system substrate-binding protein
MRMKPLAKQMLPMIVGACLLAACASATTVETTSTEQTGRPAPADGGHLTIAIDSGFIGFDPNVTPAAQDARILRQVFDTLLDAGPDGELLPWLATTWTASDDGLQYDFTLRQDVSFHDGTPFNAAAVCFNFDRIADPETVSRNAISLLGPYESCMATSEFDVRVRLSDTFAPFLPGLTSPFMGLNSPTAVAATTAAEYNLAPVGTGPFAITAYTPGDSVELARNDAYAWPSPASEHSGPALLESITVKIVPDSTVRIGSLRGGNVQIASGVPETDAATIAADPALAYIAQEQSGAPFQIHLNTASGPFADLAVRKAAAAALDIDSTLEALYAGAGTRAWGPLTPSTTGYDPSLEGSQKYDPAAAARLLDEAGWLMGEDGVRVKDGERLAVTYLEQTPNREKRQDFARFFEANLQEAGFEVNLVFETATSLLTRAQSAEYDIMGLSLVHIDPNVLYQIYDASFIPREGFSGFNYSRTDDGAIGAALAAGRAASDAATREAAYAQIQRAVVDEVRSIPIYEPKYTLAVGGVAGIRFDLQGYPVYYDAFLADFGA